ncbi:MAG: winged helix-turn-helix transcriptional regulator [Lachnospiraceae bacterium]|nr:winged helix-turn-helix transcriptional regulator [Lachnospiraceae bacterium]
MKDKKAWVGYEIHRLDNAIKKKIDNKLRSDGLDEATMTNGWVLKYLYDNKDKEVYQKDIEKHFNIGRSTVTGILKLMEQNDLVKRVSVENDARLKRVILLPKGEEVHTMIGNAVCDTNQKIMEGITSEELETLFCILNKIHNNINEEK